ncbi:NAD(P)/FAD-dependent oxidoreductase [Nocardia sp. CDC160]|uniref:NAD(P)/FAD-dependent oxidoreductase n=1 Tax=Nocardia sp. CDC160 TaxID=3112166 RepID=UPI002DB7C2F0|nr:FAD-dependent oxidoreductase [Nocardia sp. CDC160]MEC3920382.1 FAD-dependent oxidoreductase [Nocardia sp. CDC160]
MTGQHRIVILGAGYAGLAAAREAIKAKGAHITVIDLHTEFVDRVRLHQVLAGQDVARWELRKTLAAKGIEFVNGRAERIDTAACRVELATGDAVAYDTLIYALGSRADLSMVPGAAEFAHTVATSEDVRRIPALSGRVAVVGAGATGLETATELAESRPDLDVVLVSSDEPGGWLIPKAVAHIRKVLDRLGIQVRVAKVAAVTATGLDLVDGDRIDADIVLWTTGFTVPEVAARSGLPVDGRGRVLVDDRLRVRDLADVYAVGDAAVMVGFNGREARMSCQAAQPAGKYLGAAVADRLRGKQPAAFKPRFLLTCMSLGRQDGLVQFMKADDSNGSVAITGRPAAWVKEQIVSAVGRAAKI